MATRHVIINETGDNVRVEVTERSPTIRRKFVLHHFTQLVA
jgi:hypothetical protein